MNPRGDTRAPWPTPRLAGRSGRLARGARVTLVLAAVVQLLVGPAFAGSRMLWHDHGEQGVHGHLLMGLASSDHDAVHHGRHEHPHGGRPHAHMPHGVVVELPSLTLVSPGALRQAQAVAQMLAWEAAPVAFQGLASTGTGPSDRRGRLAVPLPLGSGAERILRANHALLI